VHSQRIHSPRIEPEPEPGAQSPSPEPKPEPEPEPGYQHRRGHSPSTRINNSPSMQTLAISPNPQHDGKYLHCHRL
jgi:hypothetical protein